MFDPDEFKKLLSKSGIDITEFRKSIREFNDELVIKSGLDPEEGQFVGIRIDEFAQVDSFERKIEKWHDLLDDANRLIDGFETEINGLKASWLGSDAEDSKTLESLELSIREKEREVQMLKEKVENAQNHELEEDDLLGVEFVSPEALEKTYLALKDLVKSSAALMLKLRELRNFLKKRV